MSLGATAASVAALALGLDFLFTSPKFHENTRTLTTTSQPPFTSTTVPQTVSYAITQSGNNVTATALNSDLPPIIGTDAATVISEACVPNSKVFIKAGTYVISNPNGVIFKSSNVELYGESSASTVLLLADGMNVSVLRVNGGSNVNVHDLQIDGNRANQSHVSGAGLAGQCQGIGVLNGASVTIQNCYVHDCRNVGIEVSGTASNVNILYNTVVNCDANGITIGSSGTSTVSGNTVNGASDVGITAWEANGVTATNNTVTNITMNTSPWNVNSHVGMMVENSGGNHTFSNNNISNCDGSGLCMSGGATVLYENNTISNCGRGLYAYGGSGLNVTNNTCSQIAAIPRTKKLPGVVQIDSGMGSATITGNSFLQTGGYLPSGSAVINLTSPSGTFSGNTVSTDNGKYTAITDGPSWVISNNTIVA